MDMNRLMSFPMRRLSDSEKKWLQGKMHDKCPKVADTAREVYNVCFPYAERNAMKKQLAINTLSFELHIEVYDGDGDMEMTDRCFNIDRKSRVLTMTDFHADSGEQSVTLDGGNMAKLLRYIVYTLEIFMWEQDYCLNSDEDDFFTDILPKGGIYVGDPEKKDKALSTEPEGRQSWQVHVEYSNHTVQDISSYDDYLPERPEELYGKGRSFGLQDMTEDDYMILEKTEVSRLPVLLQARVADILWTERKDYKIVPVAIKAYHELYNITFDTENWSTYLRYIKRSITLAAKTGAKKFYDKYRKELFDKVIEVNGGDKYFFSISAIKFLIVQKWKDCDPLFIVLDNIIEKSEDITKAVKYRMNFT